MSSSEQTILHTWDAQDTVKVNIGQSGHTSSVGLLKGCTALALLTRRSGLCNTTRCLNGNVTF